MPHTALVDWDSVAKGCPNGGVPSDLPLGSVHPRLTNRNVTAPPWPGGGARVGAASGVGLG